MSNVQHEILSLAHKNGTDVLYAAETIIKQREATNKELLSALENLFNLTSAERGAMMFSEYREAKEAITNAKQVMGDRG